MTVVSPLTLYESNKPEQLVVDWECTFAFKSNEYKLTVTCSCGSLLSAHFGSKGDLPKLVAGYIICPDCRKNWYYELPTTFIFRETNTD
jgi:hypothetical protein